MAINSEYNIKQITNEDIDNYPETMNYGIVYKTILENVQILKMGYCCEQKGTMYPIFIKTNGDYQEIQLSNNGIYEVETTPKNWQINGIKVPTGIKFILDYVVNI